eukprot:750629-Pelagomonas_calceolata.AAC.2
MTSMTKVCVCGSSVGLGGWEAVPQVKFIVPRSTNGINLHVMCTNTRTYRRSSALGAMSPCRGAPCQPCCLSHVPAWCTG